MTEVRFEGEHVDVLVAQLPSTKLEDLTEAYPIGTLMNLSIVVRVDEVRVKADRKGNLIRTHLLGVDDVKLHEVLTPRQRMLLESGVDLDEPISGQLTVEDVIQEQTEAAYEQ